MDRDFPDGRAGNATVRLRDASTLRARIANQVVSAEIGKSMSIHVQRYDDRGEYMTFVAMQHMPLSSAYLCEDCHCVGNCAERCPACASEALMCLAGILNREEPMEKAEVSYAITSQSECLESTLAA